MARGRTSHRGRPPHCTGCRTWTSDHSWFRKPGHHRFRSTRSDDDGLTFATTDSHSGYCHTNDLRPGGSTRTSHEYFYANCDNQPDAHVNRHVDPNVYLHSDINTYTAVDITADIATYTRANVNSHTRAARTASAHSKPDACATAGYTHTCAADGYTYARAANRHTDAPATAIDSVQTLDNIAGSRPR